MKKLFSLCLIIFILLNTAAVFASKTSDMELQSETQFQESENKIPAFPDALSLTENVSVSVKLGSDVSKCDIKAFLWRGESLEPLMNSIIK